MFSTGIMIIPTGPIEETLSVVECAERAGFDYCLLADESFTHDVYVTMTAIMARTSRIRVAPITNPYTRHPAITAAALASLSSLFPGRVFIDVVPGGTQVLQPLHLDQYKPLSACREMIQIVRTLLSGEACTLDGRVFQLDAAQLQNAGDPVDIWLTARGPKMVQLSGELADVTVVTSHLNVEATVAQASVGSAISGRKLELAHLGIVAFNQGIMDRMRPHYTYVLPDSPSAVHDKLDLSAEWIAELRRTRAEDGIDAATQLITDDILHRLMVSGSPHECTVNIRDLASRWGYGHFTLPVMSLDPEYAFPLMEESAQIYADAQALLSKGS